MQPLPSYGAEGNMAKTNTAKAKKRNINRIAYLFVLPFVIVFLVFSVYPVLRTLYLSFTNYKGFGDATWTGLDNYKRVITDKFFWRDLGNTIKIWGVNDACVLTTINTVLKQKKIPLVGGTGDAGKVSVNGRIYEDAVAYALVRNQAGRVKTYKENIYRKLGNYRFIASDTDKENYVIGTLNGRPAKQVYENILHVTDEEILTQTFQNPFGKINGDDTCIISIKEVRGDALACFRQVNDSDVLILLELADYEAVVRRTIETICRDFPKRSAVFSVNCLFRYKLFCERGYMETYLEEMSELGSHAGLVGYGEHYNNRFVNQSMTCVVFE